MCPMNVSIRLILMIAALSTLHGPDKWSRKTSFNFRVLYRGPCSPPDQHAQRTKRYGDDIQITDCPLASLKVTMDEYLMYKLSSIHVCTFSQISKSRNPIRLKQTERDGVGKFLFSFGPSLIMAMAMGMGGYQLWRARVQFDEYQTGKRQFPPTFET